MMKRTYLLTALMLLLLVACGPGEDATPVPEPLPTADAAAYPAPEEAEDSEAPVAPTAAADAEAYPPPTLAEWTPEAYPPAGEPTAQPEAYPAPSATPNEAKRFVLNPASVGAEEVTGTGPAGTAIRIISISYAGEELGFGAIRNDRTFTVSLNRPLQDEVIGVSLGGNSQVADFLDAPGTDIPMIGLVFDQLVVEP